MKTLPLILLLCICAFSDASTMRLLTLNDLTDASDVVVVGTIGASTYSWADSQANMWTTTPLRITEYIKWGSGPRSASVQLRHPGGTLPGPQQKTWSLLVAGVPSFKANQKVMVFLKKKGKYYELVGWAQGYFSVQANSAGQEIVSRNFDGVSFVNDVSEPIPDELTLNRLVSEVRRALR